MQQPDVEQYENQLEQVISEMLDDQAFELPNGDYVVRMMAKAAVAVLEAAVATCEE